MVYIIDKVARANTNCYNTEVQSVLMV